MNNSQFRKLLFENHQNIRSDSASPAKLVPSTSADAPLPGGMMIPRNVRAAVAVDSFTRTGRKDSADPGLAKEFISTVMADETISRPGHIARPRTRGASDGIEDDRLRRIHALEEQLKLGNFTATEFYALRDEIAGGDFASTHLVKGLDRRLLERVRRGEDVLSLNSDSGKDNIARPATIVDEQLDELEEKEVEPVRHRERDKKGIWAPQPVIGTKRTRDAILTELKEQRKKAKAVRAASIPQLDSRFTRIDAKKIPVSHIDAEGREVITVVGPDGKMKRKVRASPAIAEDGVSRAISAPGKPVLGADVVTPRDSQPTADDGSDDDIFAGVGAEYNPLGEDSEGDEKREHSETDDRAVGQRVNSVTDKEARKPFSHLDPHQQERPEGPSSGQAPQASSQKRPHSYFNEKHLPFNVQERPDHRATIEQVLKKASKMDPATLAEAEKNKSTDDKARAEKRASIRANEDRDMDDIDFNFGGNRFDDDEDSDGDGARLSEWKGNTTDGGRKKRRPKWSRGGGNGAEDII